MEVKLLSKRYEMTDIFKTCIQGQDTVSDYLPTCLNLNSTFPKP